MNRRILLFCSIAASTLSITASPQSFLSQYAGIPYHDSRYQNGPQKIPGRVLCAYYDLGGEGVAYHDSDQQNHGSGELNPADGTYLNEFRIHEGVDTSYTKFGRKPDRIDDNPFDKIVPPRDLPYVGLTGARRVVQYNSRCDVRRSLRWRLSLHIESRRNNINRREWKRCNRTAAGSNNI